MLVVGGPNPNADADPATAEKATARSLIFPTFIAGFNLAAQLTEDKFYHWKTRVKIDMYVNSKNR